MRTLIQSCKVGQGDMMTENQCCDKCASSQYAFLRYQGYCDLFINSFINLITNWLEEADLMLKVCT